MLKTIVWKIKRFRSSNNLTLQQLSDITGICIGTLSDIETGKKDDLKLSQLKAISEAFNVTVSQLIDSACPFCGSDLWKKEE